MAADLDAYPFAPLAREPRLVLHAPTNRLIKGTRYVERAYEALGRTDDAIAAYQRAIVTNDSDVWALNNLGALYIRLERFEDAIGPLARAIELEDKVATFHNNLGMALELTGRIEDAVSVYRAALAIEGTYGKAVANLQRVESVKQDPTVTAVDLRERSKRFQEEVDRWREPPTP